MKWLKTKERKKDGLVSVGKKMAIINDHRPLIDTHAHSDNNNVSK